MSSRRPRETLGGLNLNSAIPQPPSAMKRQSHIGSIGGPASHARSMSGSRHSLALQRPNQPMFQRSSSGTNLADVGLSSVKRASVSAYTGGGSNTTSLKPSYHTAGGGPSSSQDNDRRSSSVYRARPSGVGGPSSGGMGIPTGGHQSFFQQAPQAAGVPRDPRPLRDRSYQNRLGQELVEYLAQNNFEMEMSHKLSDNFIKSPTQKDFNFMFQWLYRRIDPSYRFQKNIDQEVPPLLKQMRYPYEKSITKSQIAAVGGQNWSTFLGLLHWMMQLAQMLDRYAHNQYDEACLEAGVDVTGDTIIFNFLTRAYQNWLNMDDDAGDEDVEAALAPHVERMAAEFHDGNAKYCEELKMLEAENERLQKEIEELEKSTPDPAVLDNHFKIMQEDRAKFEEYNTLVSEKSDRYEAKNRILQQELEKLVDEVREAEEERRRLQRAVDEQGISMQDIDRMTGNRERLQREIESANLRLEDVKRKVLDRELEASRRLEELERAVDKFNTVAYQIGLIPATAVNAKGKEYELQVTVNDGPSDFSSSLGPSSSAAAGQGGGGIGFCRTRRRGISRHIS